MRLGGTKIDKLGSIWGNWGQSPDVTRPRRDEVRRRSGSSGTAVRGLFFSDLLWAVDACDACDALWSMAVRACERPGEVAVRACEMLVRVGSGRWKFV